MKLDMGVMLHTGDMSYDDIIRYAQEAEALGYHGFWLTEESGKEAFSLLGVLARETRRINLCTGIVNFYSRSPTTLAMAARSIHDLSNGRFGPFGVGTGGVGFMERGHGIAIDRPVGRAREVIEIVRGLLSQRRFSYPEGKWFRPRDFHLREGPIDKTIPIWLAALGPAMAEMAGKVADGMIANWLVPESLAIYRERLGKGTQQAGRKLSDVTVAALTQVTIDHADPEAVQAQKRGLAFYCASKHYHPIADAGGFGDEARKVYDIWQTGDFRKAAAAVSDAFMKKFSITGDEQTARNYLQWMKAEGCYPIIYPLPRHSNLVEDHFIAMRNMAKAASW
jgi:alkanesulfonate monooxygenase SsuD/methylene tetrahydromethanopterin reductase-like flavin-dependent oxidoreductase (luciferase family)